MTTEEFLALADDGVERWLIEGEVREWGGGKPMTVRNALHSAVMAEVARVLGNWRWLQPKPRGKVYCGEAGIKLAWAPETTVGADVAYVSAEVLARRTGDTTLVEGIPRLIVEILSPSSTVGEIKEKIDLYLSFRIPMVWVIDLDHRTATIYQPDSVPRFVNEEDELGGGDVLPGFRVHFGDLFDHDPRCLWNLIAKIDCAALDDGDETGAVEPLAELQEPEIFNFEEHLAQVLYALDGKQYAECAGESGGSGDGFLYIRCYVVAQGKMFYESVLTNPKMMPNSIDQWSESLLYVAPEAWSSAMGQEDWDSHPAYRTRRAAIKRNGSSSTTIWNVVRYFRACAELFE